MTNYSKFYKWQRLSALVLAFIFPCIFIKMITVKKLGYYGFIKDFQNIETYLLYLAFINIGFYHCYLGINSIFLDYIATTKNRNLAMCFVGLIILICVLISCYSLTKLLVGEVN